MNGELPLRIVDQPGGAVIRCLCGAEASTLRRAVSTVGVGPARMAVSQPGLSPDVTPAAILMMIVHAKRCERGQRIAAEQVDAGKNMRIPVANVPHPE